MWDRTIASRLRFCDPAKDYVALCPHPDCKYEVNPLCPSILSSASCLSVSARFSLCSSLFFLRGRTLAGTIPRSASFLFGAEPFPPLPASPGTEPLRASTLSAPFPLPSSFDLLSSLLAVVVQLLPFWLLLLLSAAAAAAQQTLSVSQLLLFKTRTFTELELELEHGHHRA